MATMARAVKLEDDHDIIELSEEQSQELFENAAQSILHMSGEEFVRTWKKNGFGDPDSRPGVLEVAMLMPLQHSA